MTSLPQDILSRFTHELHSEFEIDSARLQSVLQPIATAATGWHEALGAQSALNLEEFLVYIAERLPGHSDLFQELSRLHTEDLLLAKLCSEGDTAALSRFESEILGVVLAAGRKLKMDDLQCQELQQMVRMKLLVVGKRGGAPKISNFAGSGALRSWVYATGLRTGLNELRRIGRAPMPAGDEQLLVAMPDRNDDQELQYMKELYRSAFRDSFRSAIAQLPPRLANVLRHYYLDEMILEEIGVLYRVHKTTVMRWVNRAHAELELGIKNTMVTNLSLNRSEVESVLRLIQSGIHLGLASVLAAKATDSSE